MRANLVTARSMVLFTTRTWSCDQSCRVVPPIGHDRGLVRLVWRLTGRPYYWSCRLCNSSTTGTYLCDTRKSKIASRSYCILPGLTKFTPNFMSFSGYTMRRLLGFMSLVLQFATISHWIILFSLISFIFLSVEIPTFMRLFRSKTNINAEQYARHCLGQHAHTYRRFTKWFCQLVSCPKLAVMWHWILWN